MKKYLYDNSVYEFNTEYFNQLFTMHKSKTIGEYEAELGDVLSKSRQTIHAWRNGVNAPSDIEVISDIAMYWNVPIETLLVRRNKKLTTEQIDSLSRILRSYLDYEETGNKKELIKTIKGEYLYLAHTEVYKEIKLFMGEGNAYTYEDFLALIDEYALKD